MNWSLAQGERCLVTSLKGSSIFPMAFHRRFKITFWLAAWLIDAVSIGQCEPLSELTHIECVLAPLMDWLTYRFNKLQSDPFHGNFFAIWPLGTYLESDLTFTLQWRLVAKRVTEMAFFSTKIETKLEYFGASILIGFFSGQQVKYPTDHWLMSTDLLPLVSIVLLMNVFRCPLKQSSFPLCCSAYCVH